MSDKGRKMLDEAWAQVKDNIKVLNGCALPHDFPEVNAFEERRSVCKRCGGWLDVLQARWYMRGLAHAARPPRGDKP